jgi:thiol-disulfide isomerase/thioredoxin
LKSNSGENIRLKELKGNVVLLNFWASWCGPCRKEMPELEKLYKKYQRLGFTVLGVNVETESSAANKILKKSPVSFPVLYDTENTASKLYNVNAMPTTVIIDRSGNMRFLHLAYKAGYEEMYEKQIKQLIRE